MKREKKTIICSILFIVLAGILYQQLRRTGSTQEELLILESPVVTNQAFTEDIQVTEAVSQSSKYCCYVCGAVRNPGVYDFPKGTRLNEVIDLAGGFTEDAASAYLNLAQQAEDGEKIYVPTIMELASWYPEQTELGVEKEAARSGETAQSEEQININTADIDMLTTLPGIGETKANYIVSYREEHGEFQSIEELKNVEGIKEGVFEKIKNLIAVQ